MNHDKENNEKLAPGDVFVSDSVCPRDEMLVERTWWSCGTMWVQICRADGRGESFQVERPRDFRIVRRMRRVMQWVPA